MVQKHTFLHSFFICVDPINAAVAAKEQFRDRSISMPQLPNLTLQLTFLREAVP